MSRDTNILTLKERLSKEERALAFCIRQQLPFADSLEVIAYLRRALDANRGTDAE